MRVTDKMGYNQVTANLQKNRGEMQELQNQAATQKKVNKPSDDPVAAARVLSARTEEKMNKQFIKNMNLAKGFLEASDQSLGELADSLMRAKELTIQASNDPGGGEDTRRITSLEIGQIFNQAVQIGNRKLGERYIFGGYKTTSQPFTPTGDYMGDDGDMKIQINKDAYVAMNMTGDKVFMGRGLGEDGIARASANTPTSIDDLKNYKQDEQRRLLEKEEQDTDRVDLRTPSSVGRGPASTPHVGTEGTDYKTSGINVLGALKDLEIGLKVNDKTVIQDSIDSLDQAIAQVVHARAQVGSRITALNNTTETLQKQIIENKMTASQFEDADLFQVVSDMQKSDSTLKATLETSGRVIQPSLLDFLK